MKALITGASSGIGKALAYELASRGIDLILVARRGLILKELKNDLPVNVKCYQLDISDMKNIEFLYKEVRDEDIDIVINNAGFGLFGNFNETEDKGYILNVASSAGFLAGPHLSIYYATKNYICRMDEAIYQELKEMKSNVHVSSLCPGPVNTEFNKVAGGTFATKGMKADYVAKVAIDGMFKGKMNIVPGFKYKAGLFFNKLIPKKLALKIISNYQQKKISK